MDFTFESTYTKELRDKLFTKGGRPPMADLDGLIPLEVLVKFTEVTERHRRQEYKKYN